MVDRTCTEACFDKMKNQVLSNRYIDRKDLIALLKRLFGLNYFLEVCKHRVLRLLYWADVNRKQTKGDEYILQVERSLTKVVSSDYAEGLKALTSSRRRLTASLNEFINELARNTVAIARSSTAFQERANSINDYLCNKPIESMCGSLDTRSRFSRMVEPCGTLNFCHV